MKPVLVVLGIVAFISEFLLRSTKSEPVLGLAAHGSHGVAAYVDSAEFNAFVSTSLVSSAGSFHEGAVVESNEGFPRIITSNVTCNGVPFTGSKCVGETIVLATLVFRFSKSTFVCSARSTIQLWRPRTRGCSPFALVTACTRRRRYLMKVVLATRTRSRCVKERLY